MGAKSLCQLTSSSVSVSFAVTLCTLLRLSLSHCSNKRAPKWSCQTRKRPSRLAESQVSKHLTRKPSRQVARYRLRATLAASHPSSWPHLVDKLAATLVNGSQIKCSLSRVGFQRRRSFFGSCLKLLPFKVHQHLMRFSANLSLKLFVCRLLTSCPRSLLNAKLTLIKILSSREVAALLISSARFQLASVPLCVVSPNREET